MIDALYYVHETASEEDMDVLLGLAKSRKVQRADRSWLANRGFILEQKAEGDDDEAPSTTVVIEWLASDSVLAWRLPDDDAAR